MAGFKTIEQDLPRGGRKPKIDPAEIVRLTTQTKPDGATQRSTRTLAAVAGVSDTTIQRVWKSRGLKPHRVKRFKVSRDPKFVEKLEDTVSCTISMVDPVLIVLSSSFFERQVRVDIYLRTTALSDLAVLPLLAETRPSLRDPVPTSTLP